MSDLNHGRWLITDPGAKDDMSAGGYAAPSWHTFTGKEWSRGPHVLRLENFQWPKAARVHGKATTYEVSIQEDGETVYRRAGHDWQAMVREAKEWCDGRT